MFSAPHAECAAASGGVPTHDLCVVTFSSLLAPVLTSEHCVQTMEAHNTSSNTVQSQFILLSLSQAEHLLPNQMEPAPKHPEVEPNF